MNGTELTSLMSNRSAVLIAVLAATAGTYAFQLVITNRKVSELSVTKSLTQITDGTWTFVAMQYYFGILNRTYLIFVTDSLNMRRKSERVKFGPESAGCKVEGSAFLCVAGYG
jgi:hypothetical protein